MRRCERCRELTNNPTREHVMTDWDDESKTGIGHVIFVCEKCKEAKK